MKACTLQTEAKLFGYLCSVSEEAILHILSDVKMTHSIAAEVALDANPAGCQKEKELINEKSFGQQIRNKSSSIVAEEKRGYERICSQPKEA